MRMRLLVFAASVPTLGFAAHAAERAQVPESLKWNLSDLYQSEEAWQQAKAELVKRIPELAKYKGHLGDSAAALADALNAMTEVEKKLARLGSYSMQLRDEDTRNAKTEAMAQSAEQLGVDFSTVISYVRPELLSLDPKKVKDFLAKEPRLKEHAFFLEDVLRYRPHTLSPAEERIVAEAGNLANAGDSVYSIFTNADLPYPEVKIGKEKVRLDAAAYTRFRATKARADRKKVFESFWGAYKGFTRTLGMTLYAQVKSHVFDKTVHKFGSSLESALFSDNIPTTVYTQLIADVHQNLPTLHRYLGLRKRMMGLEELRYFDLYAPIVKEVELSFTPEQAMKMTLDSSALLGPDYVAALDAGYKSNWVDFMPSTGKRSGAYSNSVYEVHPFQLLNYMGQYEDVSTLAHESGHSMHSYLSAKGQPFPTADYSIFVAEVASTLNENLLLHDTLAKTKDDATRLYLLGSYLDNLRQTLFRQTLFADFEARIHEQVEKGEPLTGEGLTATYLGLLREYYGHKEGVCIIDDLYGIEWAYIPHFYYNFYVYQYATSLVASTSIAKAIREEGAKGETKTRDAYIKLLSAGGSKYPIELLKDVGVDMTTSKPFQAAVAEMNRIMDEMEALLAKAPAGKAKKK